MRCIEDPDVIERILNHLNRNSALDQRQGGPPEARSTTAGFLCPSDLIGQSRLFSVTREAGVGGSLTYEVVMRGNDLRKIDVSGAGYH